MRRLLHDKIYELNKLYALYNLAIRNSRPYRITKVKQWYEAAKASVKIYTITYSNYKDVLPIDSTMERITELKKVAIKNKDYEEAAIQHDRENERLNFLLTKRGVSMSDKFFGDQGRIYEKGFIL